MKRVTTKVLIILHLLELLGRLRFIFRSAVAGRRNAFFTSFGTFQSHNYAVTFCHKNDRLSAQRGRFKPISNLKSSVSLTFRPGNRDNPHYKIIFTISFMDLKRVEF